jgi:hypothetical protein
MGYTLLRTEKLLALGFFMFRYVIYVLLAMLAVFKSDNALSSGLLNDLYNLHT